MYFALSVQSLLIQLGVKECIIPLDEAHKDYELIKLKGVLTRCNVVATERKRGKWSYGYGHRTLSG
jgi:DNA mismatch repair protein MSH2